MKTRFISVFIFFSFVFEGCLFFSPAQATLNAQDIKQKNTNSSQESFAFSLRESQKILKKCMPDDCHRRLLQIDGMTRVVGFVVDPENEDIILIGKKQKNSPALYLEDFVLALRKAWDLIPFEEENGMINRNVIDKTPIGCSIDPKPETNKKWLEFNKKYKTGGPQIISNSAQAEKVRAEFQEMANDWVTICQDLQTVRVDGLYHTTRFSKIMVEADYYTKRLVDGSEELDIDGFKSLTDIRAAQESKSLKTSMNRFWFTPGENIYLETEHGVFLKKSPVTLLTEEEHLTNAGARKGKGDGDPLAKEFAEKFTKKYSIIKKRKPIYEELEGLFRFVAATKAMGKKKEFLESIGTLEYFLYQFPITTAPVWAEVSGRSRVGKDIFNFFLTCGGVIIDPILKLDHNNNHYEKLLSGTRLFVLSARPSQRSIRWTYRDFLYESGILPIVNTSSEPIPPSPQPLPKGEKSGENSPTATTRTSTYENNKKKQKSDPGTEANKKEETEHQDNPESSNIKHEKAYRETSRIRPVVIHDNRVEENLEAIKMLNDHGKAAILLDFIHDKKKFTVGKFSKKGDEYFDESAIKKLNELMTKTKRISGRLGGSIQNDWLELVNNYLLPSRKKKEISIKGKMVNIDKPILILRTDHNELDFNNFEKIDALKDHFYLYILLKQTHPKQFAKNVINVPVIDKNNVVITVSMPEMTSKQEKADWNTVLSEFRKKIGNENVIINPSKEKFKRFLEKQGKDCIVLNATHTEKGIVFKNNEQFTSSDVRQLGNLNHIKYFMTGIGSCEVGRISEGNFVKYLRMKGMGSVNFSGKKLIGEKIIDNFRILLDILDDLEEFEIPAYAVPDIIRQLKKDDEIGVLNISKTLRHQFWEISVNDSTRRYSDS